MSKSKIEWTDAVWNPVTGCNKVSQGCRNCYAERMSKRLAGRCGYPLDDPFKVTLHPDKLGQPLRWTKPRKIFANSMSDLFHEQVPDEFIARLWWVMGQCAGYLDPSRYRGHTFMILTKRPERMKAWLDGWMDQETRKRWIESNGEVFDWMSGPKYWPDILPNVWLGVSVENQAAADERIPLLLQTPAEVRFISAEPLLGPIDLNQIVAPGDLMEFHLSALQKHHDDCLYSSPSQLDQVIVGGESSPGARPMHPDWVRSLRDQCQAASVPFFFKQWGNWAEVEPPIKSEQHPDHKGLWLHKNGDFCRLFGKPSADGATWMEPIGKKKAGRELDGRTWDEMPVAGGKKDG